MTIVGEVRKGLRDNLSVISRVQNHTFSFITTVLHSMPSSLQHLSNNSKLRGLEAHAMRGPTIQCHLHMQTY